MFDLVVIGSGPGGYVACIRAAQLGMKVALVEKHSSLGGTCLNVGCIPSKALLDSSEHYFFAQKHLKEHGVNVSSVHLNLEAMLKRKDQVVGRLTQGINHLMKKNKVTRYKGWGRLKDPHTVEIQGDSLEQIKGKSLLIATGSVPQELRFLPFDKKQVISSTEALSLESVPEKMIIIGAGAIGLELGSVWNRLGTEVEVLERNSKICGSMDKQMSLELQKLLEKQGLKFHMKAQLKTDIKKSSRGITLTYADPSGTEKDISAPIVLVAVGRKPFHEGLGIKDLGLQTNERGHIQVNSHFQTSLESVYAIGDVIEGPMLAHKAEEEAVAFAELLAGQAGHVHYEALPSVVYTHPELACVGKTEEELQQTEKPFKKGVFPFAANGRAQAMGFKEGLVKVLACKDTDQLLGVHILGPHASDVLSEAVLAMEFQASCEDVARSFHSHPTFTEALREACLNCYNQSARQI